jgi:hypothetical protein
MSLAHSIPWSQILLLIEQMLINHVLITRPRLTQQLQPSIAQQYRCSQLGIGFSAGQWYLTLLLESDSEFHREIFLRMIA